MRWTPDRIARARALLRQTPRGGLDEALRRLGCSYNELRGALRRAGLPSLTEHLYDPLDGSTVTDLDGHVVHGTPRVAPPVPPAAPAPPADRFARLVEACRRPVEFAALCDALDVSPARCLALVDEARVAGYQVSTNAGVVGMRQAEPDERVRDVVPPIVGERQVVGVISDTHLGSKYCLRPQLRDFVEYAYARGVRRILHPGDVLDGCYRHGLWEVSHSGLDAQAADLLETLPALPGLTYHAITGNHDATFTDASGLDVGTYLESLFAKNGRRDLHFYGNRGAFLRVQGAVFHLWHPRSGGAYARSYPLQKQIEKYAPGEKPDVLLAGHWHTFCYVEERGIHAIACPTFQGGGSAFGKSLGGAPALGGLVLSWDLTEHGTLRAFSIERRAYYEREAPRRVAEAA